MSSGPCFEEIPCVVEEWGQEHVLRFWGELSEGERKGFLGQLGGIDFRLMQRLIETWMRGEPAPERFGDIEPVPVIPVGNRRRADAREAWDAGEEALRSGRGGLVLVAGGQGTRLGFDGPKGAYPIGPLTGKSLFEYHADKIHNLQRRYACTFPWYIMVSEATEAATKEFFRDNGYFGLEEGNVFFFEQGMVPCVDDEGKFLLESRGRLAMNPNGHGGCLPAMVERGVTRDARKRGVTVLSYCQVDNWAANIADPYFIGYHVLRGAEMSSKVHRRNGPREPVGVHCLCDGEHRVIEYTELDRHPELLATDPSGGPLFYAGNPAIHVLSVEFVESVCQAYDQFPWHRAHKKIPHIDERGQPVNPDKPNGYKFETFIFDALRFVEHEPVALEIDRAREFTPVKNPDGPDSVESARAMMGDIWAGWLEAAGYEVPRKSDGMVAVRLEISPRFALDEEEFVARAQGRAWPTDRDLAIDEAGESGQPGRSGRV